MLPAFEQGLGGELGKVNRFRSVLGGAQGEHTGQVGTKVDDLSRVLAKAEEFTRVSGACAVFHVEYADDVAFRHHHALSKMKIHNIPLWDELRRCRVN